MTTDQWLQLAALVVSSALTLYVARMVHNVHVLINSRLSQLLSLTETSSFAAGREAQRTKPEADNDLDTGRS